MKWLEIIEVRSASSTRELLKSQVQTLLHEVARETKKQVIRAYSQAMIDTDLSIHLYHESRNVEKSGSTLGLRLASMLKEFGLVHHSIWIEMQGS